jgi:hypothetical protein
MPCKDWLAEGVILKSNILWRITNKHAGVRRREELTFLIADARAVSWGHNKPV